MCKDNKDPKKTALESLGRAMERSVQMADVLIAVDAITWADCSQFRHASAVRLVKELSAELATMLIELNAEINRLMK